MSVGELNLANDGTRGEGLPPGSSSLTSLSGGGQDMGQEKGKEPSREYKLDDMYAVIERRVSRADMRKIYRDLFGKTTAGTNGDWLRNKIAYELQRRLRYPGGEPDKVRARREGLGDVEPERKRKVEKAEDKPLPRKRERDPRLPSVGAVIERAYGGRTIRLRVGDDCFELLDEDGGVRTTHKSISGAASAVCVCEVNGYVFFGLDSKQKKGKEATE